jgi:hypothetical protein
MVLAARFYRTKIEHGPGMIACVVAKPGAVHLRYRQDFSDCGEYRQLPPGINYSFSFLRRMPVGSSGGRKYRIASPI